MVSYCYSDVLGVLGYMRYIIKIPVTSLLYLSYVAVRGLTPMAHMTLLLDSVAGGQSWQVFLQGPGGDSVSFVGLRDCPTAQLWSCSVAEA